MMTDSMAATTTITDVRVLVLDEKDNVCVACVNLDAGTKLVVDGVPLLVLAPVPLGHKLARIDIGAGQTVFKYGAPIGSATRDVARGEHVHIRNLRSGYLPTYTLDGSNRYVVRAR
jgi:altronate dehydratase